MSNRSRSATVRAESVSDAVVRESVAVENAEAVQLVQDNAARLAFNGLWLDFSPYWIALEPPREGTSWDALKAEQFNVCMRSAYTCKTTARLIGREKVRTAAGEFEALKVELELEAIPVTANSYTPRAMRSFTFWYAEAAKRMVKARSRLVSGNSTDPDYDVELISFRLK
jgi:hypothetical protein